MCLIAARIYTQRRNEPTKSRRMINFSRENSSDSDTRFACIVASTIYARLKWKILTRHHRHRTEWEHKRMLLQQLNRPNSVYCIISHYVNRSEFRDSSVHDFGWAVKIHRRFQQYITLGVDTHDAEQSRTENTETWETRTSCLLLLTDRNTRSLADSLRNICGRSWKRR